MSKFQELLQSNKPILVDFSAEWCGPCKQLAPILKQVASEIGDKATIIKVDVDKNQQAAAHFHIQSVPTLILFKSGKQLWRQSGVVPKQMLIQIINQYV
jgi:thioredoxin 1